MSKITYGSGTPFGYLYFSNAVGLAQKNIGDDLSDNRKGKNSLQYKYNGGIMQGFGLVDFPIQNNFDANGRLGRLLPVTSHLKTEMGVGIDSETCLFYNDGKTTVYGRRGVFFADFSRNLPVKG